MAKKLHGFVRIATGRAMEIWGGFVRNARLIATGRVEQVAGEAMLVRARMEPAGALGRTNYSGKSAAGL